MPVFLLPVVSALFPLLFAPQLDFASLAPVGPQAKGFTVRIEVRLASGKTEETGFSFADHPSNTRESLRDNFVRWCGSQAWTFKVDGLKVSLFDVEGGPIVGITVRTTGKNGGGNPVPVPGLAYRWVPRVPPKVTWVCLSPRPIGGTRLARAMSGAFAAAVATVAAPEVDFAALPDGKDRPQAYEVWCLVRLASGGWGKTVGDVFVGKVVWVHLHVTRGAGREELRARFSDYISDWYELRDEVGGLRVALWQYFEAQGDGTVKRDRVVGLAIESNGPAPGVRWVFRPEYRRKFLRE